MTTMVDQRRTHRIAATDVKAPSTRRHFWTSSRRRRSRNPTAYSTDAYLWRGAAIGAALGFVFVTALITAIGIAVGYKPINSLGLGAFVGLWGGSGFGMMVGGIFAMQAAERHSKTAGRDSDR